MLPGRMDSVTASTFFSRNSRLPWSSTIAATSDTATSPSRISQWATRPMGASTRCRRLRRPPWSTVAVAMAHLLSSGSGEPRPLHHREGSASRSADTAESCGQLRQSVGVVPHDEALNADALADHHREVVRSGLRLVVRRYRPAGRDPAADVQAGERGAQVFAADVVEVDVHPLGSGRLQLPGDVAGVVVEGGRSRGGGRLL